ncbi:MAG TPA: tRNA lysidine(34) synthetase TilS [Verrucomicrobiae bacterium]|nr:tRNA lysidine(34) synthetase TilS [Verrucomicrobiae bacterium]
MAIPASPPAEIPERFVFALSGGVDSVCLLDWLVMAGRRPVVAHFNHRWAKREDTDARFCAKLASDLGLPFALAAAPPTLPRTEECARAARYRFLLSVARRRHLGVIVIAHNADDQAETLLLRLLRGAGTRGLAAMRTESEMGGTRIVRPWLAASRAEILARARTRGLTWREDPFNRDTRLLRSRVRHRLMPLLRRQFAPDIVTRLGRTAAILADEDRWLDQAALQALARCRDRSQPARLVKPALDALPPPILRRVLLLWFAEHRIPDIGFAEVESAIGLLESGKPAKINLPGARFLRRREKRLFIE